MPDYSSWEKGDLSTEVLLLDVLNPRIPPSEKKFSQKQLLEILVEHDDVYELARSITNAGYITVESLIGVRENGNIVIVEGNRRLAACKLLFDPSLSPPSYHSRFRSLSERIDKTTVSKVEVQIAPNREAAMPYIAAKHTRSTVKPWEPLMKANFYLRQIKQGLSVEQIAHDLSVTPGDIKKMVLSATMYYEAIKINFGGVLGGRLKDPRQFNISTLGRIFETPDGKKYFGIDQDREGSVTFTISQRTLKTRLARVVADILNGRIDTRTLNTTAQITSYLFGRKPKRIPRPRAVRVSRPISPFIPANIVCRVASPRIRDVFIELQDLNVSQFPNSYAMNLRLLLELGTYNYMTSKGYLSVLESEVKIRTNNHVPHTFPELFEMLVWLAGNDQDLDVATRAFLRRLASRSSKDPVLDDLNLFVHNISWNPDPRSIATIWKNFANYFQIILG